ncbi:hypothetical protein M8C21_007464, partial [Ambrosia artemisiifolia]
KNQQQNANLAFPQAKAWAKLLNTFCTSGKLELELLQMVQVQCYEDTRLMKFPEVEKLCESVGGICGLLGVVKDWLLIAYSLLMITDTITPLNLLGYVIAFLGECHLFRFVHLSGAYNMENLQEQISRGVLTDPYIACVLNCMFCIFYVSYSLPFGGVKDSGFGRFAGVHRCKFHAGNTRASGWIYGWAFVPESNRLLASASTIYKVFRADVLHTSTPSGFRRVSSINACR